MDDSSHSFIPRIGNDLAPRGAVARSCDNSGLTKTVPGHTCIGSGRYQSIPNDGTIRSSFPHIWEYYRAATGAPDRDAIVLTTKSKLACLSHSDHADYGAPDSAWTIAGLDDDDAAVDRLVFEIATRRPTVSLVSLADVDAAAHGGVWDDYTRAIRRADSLIFRLWTSAQLYSEYMDRTAFVIIGDHGRHSDAHGSWTDHGDACPGCRRIPLICLGPDFEPGAVSWTLCQQSDLCRTLGAVLGIPTPLAGGRVLTELMGVSDVGPRPQPANGIPIRRSGRGVCFEIPPMKGPATMQIFDPAGRSLHDGRVTPGRSWCWSAPASGAYFYRLLGPDVPARGRVLVVE